VFFGYFSRLSANPQIHWIAKHTFESPHVSERNVKYWANGVIALWRKLSTELRFKDDRAADIELDDHTDEARLQNLFTEALEKLREDAAQGDPRTDSRLGEPNG
jgi:hypothetical protein